MLKPALAVALIGNSTQCEPCFAPNFQPLVVRNDLPIPERVIRVNRSAVWYPTLAGSPSDARQYRPHRGFCLLRYDNPRFPGERMLIVVLGYR